MAHINTPPPNPAQEGPTHHRQPSPEERCVALAVLLTGRPTPDDPAVEHFIQFTRQQGMSLDGLWASYQGETPVASVLIIPSAGRAAVLFASPITTQRRVVLASDLVKTAIQAQDPAGANLIQSLLDPTQRHEREALEQAGFFQLASLVYMRASSTLKLSARPGINPGSSSPTLDDPDSPLLVNQTPLTVLPWHEDHYDRFSDAIVTSYEDTLDCPGLVGIRQIEDIIAGHMAVGRFDPTLWSAFYLDDQPVGVLLLNPLADQSELELVYLGLTPSFRNQGLATRLMRRAASIAKARRFSGIHLAVDERNTPAVKLYRALNYRATARKVAMIYALS